MVVDDAADALGRAPDLKEMIPPLAPTQNASGAHGFGRAECGGLDHSRGDAVSS